MEGERMQPSVRSVLITGGTGSFGRCLTRYLIKNNFAERVVIFSRDEWKQWDMQQSEPVFRDPRIRYFLGDVRDQDRLYRAFSGVDAVIHAAALKQVPAAEYNPTEFVKTNVMGAMNVTQAAIDAGVKKLIALSTDKAVNPVNLYGATKLCQDKLVVAANSYVGAKGFPIFSVVRYGNVAGSRGSLIPFWLKLAKNKEALPLTDPRMTRFWISLQDSVHFVWDSLLQMQGGEIFVPKLPSFHIKDLAKAINPEIPTKEVGIRPGEKIDELLLNSEEARHTLEMKNSYTVFLAEPPRLTLPSYHLALKEKRGLTLPDDFSYDSGNNPVFLSIEELKSRLKNIIEQELQNLGISL